MREAILLTGQPIDPKMCSDILKKAVSDVIGNDTVVSFGKSQKSIYIWFPSIARIEERFIYDEISDIPDALVFGTHLEYHRNCELKKVVELLSGIYPELCLIDNDDGVFSAAEYLAQSND